MDQPIGVEAIELGGSPMRLRKDTGPFPRAPGKRISGQMARFTVFQKKDRVQIRAGFRSMWPSNQAASRSSLLVCVAGADFPMIRRSSAATPSSTARFSFIRLEWL